MQQILRGSSNSNEHYENAKSTSLLWYLALVLNLALLSLLLALPFALQRHAWEGPLESLAVFFVIGFALTSLWAARYLRSRANGYRAVTAVILAVFVCVAASNRAFEVERLNWEVHGNVEDKYKSSNHGALALRIAGTRYEYVDAEFWNRVR